VTSRTAISFFGGVSLAVFAVGCAISPEMKLVPGGRACPGPEPAAPSEAIAWYGPIGSGDERSNARWCGTVGPVAVDPVPGVRLPEPAPDDSLAVISWNILIGGGDVSRFLQEVLGYGCHRPSPELPTDFSHFVLLIQEAHRRSEVIPDLPESFRFPPRIVPESRPEGWPDIVELAQQCGLALYYVPSQRNGPETIDGGREDKGNAILSTLPLADLVAIELPYEAGRKVAIGATVKGPGGKQLRVVSIHLDVASTLYRTLTRVNTARLRQSQGVLEALALTETPGAPVRPCGQLPHPIPTVAAGDFNTWSAGESAIDQMRSCFPDSPPWDGLSTHRSFSTDFIFFRKGGEGSVRYLEGSERRVGQRYGSDHHARIAWFGWSE
jgi:endonuclease/exonuclease/phosphatase family metal-dependent hydrolase